MSVEKQTQDYNEADLVSKDRLDNLVSVDAGYTQYRVVTAADGAQLDGAGAYIPTFEIEKGWAKVLLFFKFSGGTTTATITLEHEFTAQGTDYFASDENEALTHNAFRDAELCPGRWRVRASALGVGTTLTIYYKQYR